MATSRSYEIGIKFDITDKIEKTHRVLSTKPKGKLPSAENIYFKQTINYLRVKELRFSGWGKITI